VISLDAARAELERVARLRRGDQPALEEIVAQYWSSIVRYVDRLVHDRDVAEDVAQTAFVRLWQIRDTITANASVAAILYRSARSLAIDELRKAETRRLGGVARIAREARPPETPSEAFEHGELGIAIEGALAALPARRREAFVLYHLHNQSYRQIAEIMDIAPQVVANYISAALAELRSRLRVEIADYLETRSNEPPRPRL